MRINISCPSDVLRYPILKRWLLCKLCCKQYLLPYRDFDL